MITENGCMNVNDRIYGPYSTEKMASFAEEKRLAYHSLVAPAGSRDFRPALHFEELRVLFSGTSSKAPGAKEAVHLVLFGSNETASRGANAVLSHLPSSSPLTGTAYIVKSSGTAEDLRDALATALPNTERAIVVTLEKASAASHGVGLNEHEALRRMLSAEID